MGNVLKNFIKALSGNASIQVSNLIISIVIVNKLGLEWYGEFILYQSIFFAAITFIKPNTVLSGVKFQIGLNKHYIATSMFLDCIPVLIYLIVMLCVSPYINLDIEYIIIAGFGVIFVNPGTIISYYRSLNRFGLLSSINTISSCLKLITVILLLDYKKGIIALELCIYLICIEALIWFFLFIFCFPLRKDLFFFKKIDIEYVKYSVWGTMNSIIDLPITHLDRLVVAYNLGVGDVGAYNLIRRLASIISQIGEPLSMVLFPRFVELIRSRDLHIIKKYIKLSQIMVLAVSLMISLVAFVSFEYMDIVVFNESLSEYKVSFIAFLFAQGICVSFSWVHVLTNSLGLLKKSFYIVLLSNVFFIFSLFVLSYLYGVSGALLSVFMQNLMIYAMKIKLISSWGFNAVKT